MSPCVLVLRLLLLLHVHLAVASVGDCTSRDGMEGCSMDASHAVCESDDLTASIRALPACTTNITFSLLPGPITPGDFYNMHILGHANFSHLKNLQELFIYVKRANHPHLRLRAYDYASIKSLKDIQVLKVLRFQLELDKTGNDDANLNMYDKLRSLEVLDLTRSQLVGLSVAQHMISNQSSIKTLILKNIQQVSRDDIYSPVLESGHFMCNGNVQYLDLSYNDITILGLLPGDCNTTLQYLNLDHNIIAGPRDYPGMKNFGLYWSFFSVLTSLRTFTMSSTWQTEIYQEGLWHDTQTQRIEGLTEMATKQTPITQLLQSSPFGYIAEYDFWYEDIMKHCGNISYFDILRCYTHTQEDACVFFQCLFSDFDTDSCIEEGDLYSKLKYAVPQMCTYYKHCTNIVPVPLPPHLHSMYLHDFGKYITFDPSYPTANISTFCIHPHNNVHHIDISHSNFAVLEPVPGLYYLSGFDKLKYFNLQGCQLSLHRYKFLYPDQGSMVTELHIGGNRVGPGDILPAETLQVYIKLSVLNLSNANMLGVETGAFVNLTQLSVLDLSHNRLNSSALSTFDLSNTRLQSLNLSDNALTFIPASLRSQLDNMQHLDLYLSGNTFICSCDNLAFLQWIQSNSSSITFHYAGNHVCADSPGNTIHNIEVDSLHCDWYWVQPVIAAGSSLIVISLALALFGAYKKRWTIRNLIFRLQERLFSRPDNTPATPYKYDAFVLYSSIPDDRLWVHYKLVQELEEVYGFKLCIHHRDFLGGFAILDNIEQAIRTSRKVLVVMSVNFLSSEWCVEEVQMTSSVDRSKFLVIMYRDVMLASAPMPVVVRHLLESRTYIEWDENPQAQQLFWKKLRRALYSKHMVSATSPTDAGGVEMTANLV